MTPLKLYYRHEIRVPSQAAVEAGGREEGSLTMPLNDGLQVFDDP